MRAWRWGAESWSISILLLGLTFPTCSDCELFLFLHYADQEQVRPAPGSERRTGGRFQTGPNYQYCLFCGTCTETVVVIVPDDSMAYPGELICQ